MRTFSVRVGVKNVFWTCIALLETAYAGALGVGLASQVPPLSLPWFIWQSSLSCRKKQHSISFAKGAAHLATSVSSCTTKQANVALQVLWSRVATVSAHALLGYMLLQRACKTDLKDSKAIYSCYMFCWKLFYTEYLLIPLIV